MTISPRWATLPLVSCLLLLQSCALHDYVYERFDMPNSRLRDALYERRNSEQVTMTAKIEPYVPPKAERPKPAPKPQAKSKPKPKVRYSYNPGRSSARSYSADRVSKPKAPPAPPIEEPPAEVFPSEPDEPDVPADFGVDLNKLNDAIDREFPFDGPTQPKPAQPASSPSPAPASSDSPFLEPSKPASSPSPANDGLSGLPFAKPIPGRKGVVSLPPELGGVPEVDVSGIAPGTAVEIPHPSNTGETIRFRVP